ncbi:MAG: tetraacyldisaccharide 4'-kinase [Bacteroidota bacterium]
MIQNKLLQLLLAPFSLLYGFGVSMRDFLYRKELLKGIEFDLPVIAVGNLSIGGAGKSPHIEYLIRLLKDYLYIATLSRGYKRKTKGFLPVELHHNALQVGDEPMQFKQKFPDILVSVCESRAFAIPRILLKAPNTQVILLDDAFQHLSVKPGLNILLTEYGRPFTRDFLLPSGRLREWRSAYRRADMIIVSKCPNQISDEERAAFRQEIQPYAHQKLYFSYYRYRPPYLLLDPKKQRLLDAKMDVLLICAIAGTKYLLDYLYPQVQEVKTLEYEDHHTFTKFDIGHLAQTFQKIESDRKIILTTEKDAMRLLVHRDFIIEQKLPIFVLPVTVAFHDADGPRFDQDIRDFLLNFKA